MIERKEEIERSIKPWKWQNKANESASLTSLLGVKKIFTNESK